ncbi:Tat pathway signal sequence domain protein [Brevundimonas sp.]|uniref:Tat pathway signal sequence domain protein n=1 Tax=Brevundimonas sp. TaxID=1871086 RepID=UPI002D2BDCCE|nr:Tat pathway signal sequence domain protein [Brevundimonas sp.]HYC75802.1 Tat pathway signal sequence domain protein [Brevundimonas sp.]
MRRVFKISLASVAAAAAFSVLLVPPAADAQQRPGRQEPQGGSDRGQNADGSPQNQRQRAPRIAPLRRNAAAGPCPYVKILYDAARYVELTGDRVSASNVAYTGEIEGLNSDCAYQADEPITVHTRVLFNLGRGPQAQGEGRTYRYWIAVTERNKAVLAKEYFDLPVVFENGALTASVSQDQVVVIPRADATTSGDNFEILVGFDVTPQMAEFNRTGSRFRVNAGVLAPSTDQ